MEKLNGLVDGLVQESVLNHTHGNTPNLLSLNPLQRTSIIKGKITQRNDTVICDFGQSGTAELEKQGKKPFKRKNFNMNCNQQNKDKPEVIELDCDNSTSNSHSSLDTKRLKNASQIGTNPILMNLLTDCNGEDYNLKEKATSQLESIGSPMAGSPTVQLIQAAYSPSLDESNIINIPTTSYSMKFQICIVFVFSQSPHIPVNSYFGLVLDGGTVFLPSSMEKERLILINQTKSMYNLIFKKLDQTRKSFDTVEVNIADNYDIMVEKPGSGMFVLQKAENREPFYIAQGGLRKISELHKAIRYGKEWIIDLKVMKTCANFISSQTKEHSLIDLRYLKMLSTNFKNQKTSKIMYEFQHLKEKTKKYPFAEGHGSYELLNCAFCNLNFEYAVEHMYHLLKDKVCSKKVKDFCREKIRDSGLQDSYDEKNIPITFLTEKLTRNLQLDSKELKCGQCSMVSSSTIYYLVHLDRHLRRGRVFPCYKCAKIYLAPFWFVQHKCLMEISLESAKLQISPETNVAYLYGKVDKSVKDLILTCPNLNCTKKYDFMSGMFSHLQLRTPCFLGLLKARKIEFEWNYCVDFEKLINKVYKINASMIQCDICNEICLSEVSYMMHIDHHRLHISLECLKCNTDFVTVCSFYNHSCQTKSSPFCILCDAYKKREATPYIIVEASVLPNKSISKLMDINQLAKSIDNLMEEIFNYNEDTDSTSLNTPQKVIAPYQNRFIEFLNNTNGGSVTENPEESTINLSDDISNSSGSEGRKEDAFESVEDLLADSGDEYIEPAFEIKFEHSSQPCDQ